MSAPGCRLVRLPCAAALALLCALVAAAGASALPVIPFPGTPDASPHTDIIFSATAPSQLESVRVTGSRSGAHSGRLAALPDRAGTAFIPDHGFYPGERVAVSATASSSAAGTPAGAPRSGTMHFWFRIAVSSPGSAAVPERGRAAGARPPAAASSGRTQAFHTEPDLHPPAVGVSGDPDTTSGDFFLTAYGATQSGAMILDPRGQLVWYLPIHGSYLYGAYNLAVQRYQGRPVLTYWQGKVVDFHGEGDDVILGPHYRTVAVVHAGNGYSADLHEFQITSRGTALLDAYVPVQADLSSVGGSQDGSVYDCVIQELDIRTGKVLWEWHSLGHIPISDTYRGKPGSHTYQYLHLNSIQELPDGNLLISARNTWAVYEISKSTGNILWSLGGRHSSFSMPARARFEWQHDARLDGSTLTVFDDAAGPKEEPQSSVKTIGLDFTSHTATLVHTYTHRPPLLVHNQGNAQTLPNGNLVVGWGSGSQFSEYLPDGRQIFNARFPLGVSTYRAYRFQWSGQPLTPPAMALSPGPTGAVTVYASWNGATDVARWRILGGTGPGALTWADSAPRTGFETAIQLHGEPPYLALQALDGRGAVLGTSRAEALPAHVAIFGASAFARLAAGSGAIPVGCLTAQGCRLSLTIGSGGNAVAQAGPVAVASGKGALVHFTLDQAGRQALQAARDHRLPIEVTAKDASGLSATSQITLVGYSISGPAPPLSASQTPAVQIVSTLNFASVTGQGGVLSACYSGTACHIAATLSSDGTVIAQTRPEHLGADELGNISFRLNQAGQERLAHAPGNQLGAKLTLTDGGDSAQGDIDLVRYR